VDDGPERAGRRFPGETDGVAKPGGVNPVPARPEIDLPDRGTTLLCLDAVLGSVAVRPGRHVEALPIATGNDVLGPVMIDRTGRQSRHPDTRRRDPRLSRLVGEPQDGVAVGDVEIAA